MSFISVKAYPNFKLDVYILQPWVGWYGNYDSHLL